MIEFVLNHHKIRVSQAHVTYLSTNSTHLMNGLRVGEVLNWVHGDPIYTCLPWSSGQIDCIYFKEKEIRLSKSEMSLLLNMVGKDVR